MPALSGVTKSASFTIRRIPHLAVRARPRTHRLSQQYVARRFDELADRAKSHGRIDTMNLDVKEMNCCSVII